jgi:SagB-type dehydrogenase family enzyme
LKTIEQHRQFLRNDAWGQWESIERDQKKGVPPPSLQQPYSPTAPLIDLVTPEAMRGITMKLVDAIGRRRSRRAFTDEPLTLEELSLLLWATQGIHAVVDEAVSYRSVPSAGARHPFETYLFVHRVAKLQPGLYRYLALNHKLCFMSTFNELARRAANDDWLQPEDAVLFAWTAVPYRTEWRYGILSHKMIAIEAGHICQNLYLASEAIGAGTCAIGAFPQDEIDRLLDVDGHEEFAIYLARVGKLHY